jgi:hypothetical protein
MRAVPSRAQKVFCAAVIFIAAAGCGGRRPHLTASPTLHADVNDPVGDFHPVPDFPNPPDLARGTVDIVGGNMTFAIYFAPGTFDPASTRVTIQLDTDQDQSTGMHTTYGLGIDYVVDLWAPSSRALILRAAPGAAEPGSCNPCYVEVGSVPLTLVADGMKATAALSLIGSADGRLSFRVLAYSMRPGITPTLPTAVSDFMPDVTLPPGRVP